MNLPIKSPIQARMGSPLFLVKLAADLLRAHKDFLVKVDAVADILRETKEERARIIELPRGEKGERGLQGPQGESIVGPRGQAGKDGRDGMDGRDASQLDVMKVAEMAATLITQPKDGESPAIEAIVDSVLEKLEMDKRLEGFKTEISSYRNQLAGKAYGKDTWARGGGDTVAAGTNVTLTKNGDGAVVINATGGSSSTPLTPTGTVNAVNAVFGTTGRPSSVIADGVTYFEGNGYSYAANSITLDVPPSQYIRYYL